MTPGHRTDRILLCLAAAALAYAGTAEVAVHAQAQAQGHSQPQAQTQPQGQSQPQAQTGTQGPSAALPADYIRPTPVEPGRAPSMKVQERSSSQRVFEVRFSTGDELLSGLTELAMKQHITSAYVTGIGGLSTALLGWGDPSNGAFKKIPIDQKAELVSLIGDISMRDGRPYVHLHGVVAFSDGSTRGGHVIEAHVAPVAEIAVVALESGEASAN